MTSVALTSATEGWPPLAPPPRRLPHPALVRPIASPAGQPPGPRAAAPAIAARAFNAVHIDAAAGTVTKWSAREAGKIEREALFYRQLPPEFSNLFPRLLSAGRRDGGSFYVMGYIPSPSLSGLFVRRDAPALHEVGRALPALLETQRRFADHAPAPLDAEALFDFYWQKTEARLADLPATGEPARWLAREHLAINGQARRGWPALRAWLRPRLRSACSRVQGGFLHGDLCFSNILWSGAACRLIDPRGDFLGQVNWGDARYDLAKLLHSAHGGYDFIIHDRFAFTTEGAAGLRLRLDGEGQRRTQQVGARMLGELDRRLGRPALEDLLLLEGLLFLSMLPLHYDAPQRQMAFLAIGLELLNRCAEGCADAPVH